jgi:hypothetical protein
MQTLDVLLTNQVKQQTALQVRKQLTIAAVSAFSIKKHV